MEEAFESHAMPQTEPQECLHDARGWPLLAFRCSWTSASDRPLSPVKTGFDLTPFPATGDPRALPYRPIPLGLTLNTLFYAALWSLLLFAPGSIRRHLRRRRNLCPRCAYSLLNLPPNSPCPECGHTPHPPEPA